MDKHFKLALLLSSLVGVTACNSDDSSTVTSENYITDEYVDETPVDEGDEGDEVDTGTFANGSLENWTDGIPDSWTTIDTGISISQSSDIYYDGTSSAAISVNTETQGDTDIRQSVDVVAGTTYQFSVWVYHTDGFVSARLYVDGYQGYSDPDLVNQWQQVTYSYTATADASIEVGLRFYDQTGFDGAEVVYVDSISFDIDDGTGDDGTGDDGTGDDGTGDDGTGDDGTGDDGSGDDGTGDDGTGDDGTGDDGTSDDGTGDDGSDEANTLLNGSFEGWTDAIPDGWETIDSGITVSQNTTTYYTDLSSAEISVNTTSQGDTDIRQYVDVTAGTTYEFSAWVYHTEGYVSARVYVGDYQGYSSPELVNQWQEVTYSYTAEEDASIEVGLRFYDQTGFDGAELVYVDNITFVGGSGDETSEDETPEEETGEEETPEEENNEEESGVTALIANADFENWTNSLPDDWTTIDSDITVTENSSIYHSGSASAQVSVNSGDQGNTDIRQSVDVVADTTYTFTTWVYHTDGYVKARLYIGDYEGYSDNTLLNQWQELSVSYTATETGSIELGLRFYDQTGYVDPEIVYIDDFSLVDESASDEVTAYYASADGLTGLALKTELYNIIKDHSSQTYADIWTFIGSNSLDSYYEEDGTILDMYSENPSTSETYNYTAVTDQCGNASGEGDCYNREHSFPSSWFDAAYPMYTDIHHIFGTDGYVNNRRSNYPYGEVGSSTWVSENGSLLGTSTDTLGYTGTVFEPIDEFKGDFARAYFYMATRYQDVISTWSTNSDNADAVLDGSADYVYEDWVITMLKTWNENDPVSQKELDRNEAAYEFQGNRNPFIDHPEYIDEIWAD